MHPPKPISLCARYAMSGTDLQLSATACVVPRSGMVLRAARCAGMVRAVRGDSGRIAQILTNLIGNSIKFTAEGPVSPLIQT
eukprot:2033030-Rhodomonas_salina.1